VTIPQLLRIWLQCFFDQLIGDMRPIKVAGVDVIDPEPNDLVQDCDRAVVIFWWPEYMWTSELHGAVAHAVQDQIIGKLECAAGQGGGGHRFEIRDYELRIRKNENGCSVRCPQRSKSKIHFICAETARTQSVETLNR